MKFLRSVDNLGHSLALLQARIFESSVSNGLPSQFFIKSFMLSYEAECIDNLMLNISGLTEIEIFDSIKNNIKSKRGELFPYPVIHWIGYFYRMMAYLTGWSSKFIYKKITPSFLLKNYKTLHSLSIESQIEEIINLKKLKPIDNFEKFKKIYPIDF